MADRELTTTSFAILGHLAMQPWTMYALAAQMRRNVRYFYPRAESRVYEEPKRLVALGLATSQSIRTGKRKTTVYSITPSGHAALREWLARPLARDTTLESEGLLRVFLAPFGEERDLVSTLERMRAEIGGLVDLADRVRDEYLAGEAPFQRYAPTRALIHDFLSSFGKLVDDWAGRALAQVASWPSEDQDGRMESALRSFRRNRARKRS
jgi:PadR family transcriptional regulator, regulatory protein AphA